MTEDHSRTSTTLTGCLTTDSPQTPGSSKTKYTTKGGHSETLPNLYRLGKDLIRSKTPTGTASRCNRFKDFLDVLEGGSRGRVLV